MKVLKINEWILYIIVCLELGIVTLWVDESGYISDGMIWVVIFLCVISFFILMWIFRESRKKPDLGIRIPAVYLAGTLHIAVCMTIASLEVNGFLKIIANASYIGIPAFILYQLSKK